MEIQDISNRVIRLTDERLTDHPEMQGQVAKIVETMTDPDRINRSNTDPQVELFLQTLSLDSGDDQVPMRCLEGAE